MPASAATSSAISSEFAGEGNVLDRLRNRVQPKARRGGEGGERKEKKKRGRKGRFAQASFLGVKVRTKEAQIMA